MHQKNTKEKTTDRNAYVLLSTKPPVYPRQAARNGIEGYVRLEFDISPKGIPININVIEASPSDVFNQAAVVSFSGWRYQPKASQCHGVQLDFNMG